MPTNRSGVPEDEDPTKGECFDELKDVGSVPMVFSDSVMSESDQERLQQVQINEKRA